MKNVFITGGAGFIGSHCAISLSKKGYTPIILDNLSNSHKSVIKKLEIIINKKITFYNVDIRNKKKLKLIFKKHSCYAVIHCAGFKAVGESNEIPISYFDNNIGSTLSLLDCMQESKVFKLIFSSSASVYDDVQNLPIRETNKIGNTKVRRSILICGNFARASLPTSTSAKVSEMHIAARASPPLRSIIASFRSATSHAGMPSSLATSAIVLFAL